MKQELQRLTYQLGISAVLFLALAYASSGQVLKVKEFDFGSRDRKVLFDVVTTPGGDVLSFVAKDTGDWELYQVSNWLEEKTNVKRLVLPGYFSKKDSRKDEKPLEEMSIRVFVTRNGKFAVCIASAEWLKRVRGWAVGSATSNDIISVVDLATLKVVAQTQTGDMSLFEFHGVDLDNEGHIRVSSLAPSGRTEHGVFISSGTSQHAAFIRLDIPSLEAGARCAFDWIEDSPGKRHPQPTTDSRCDETLGSKPLGEYLSEEESKLNLRPKVCEKNNSEFCKVPGEFTPDGKFGVGFRTEGHDNIFGSWVITSQSLIVFSSARGKDIGDIKEPTDYSSRVKLTTMNGSDYLLVIHGGTHLTVYEMRD